MNTSKEYSTNQDQTKTKKAHGFENYDKYLEWLEEDFFNLIRELTKKTLELITGFVMDEKGVIAKSGKVPPEIANDNDWKAFMRFLASAGVLVTGMGYIERTIKAIKAGDKKIQNTLFPYENPEEDNFLATLNADFFPEIGDLREANGLPRSPDIFIATTGVQKYADLLKNRTFRQIVNKIKSQGRKVVIIKEGPFTEEEIKLMREAGVSWQSYTEGYQKTRGRNFIEAIASRYKNERGIKDKEPVIANTTGPRIKALFLEAGYPLFLEATLVQTNVEGGKLTYIEGKEPLGDPIEHLKDSGFSTVAQTAPLKTKAADDSNITQEFYVFGKNI